MTSVQLSLPSSDGSVTSLLSCVQQGKLRVDELLVHDLTGQFCGCLPAGEAIDLESVGDFLGAAARLMALKSEALLPAPTEVRQQEEEPPSLPQRARLEGMQPALQELAGREGAESYAALPRAASVSRRLEPWPAAVLRRAFEETQKRRPPRPLEVVAPAFMRLEVALSHLLRGLKPGLRVSLKAVLGRTSRNEAVIHFLALLELVRRQQAVARQEGPFDEIIIEPVEPERRVSARAG